MALLRYPSEEIQPKSTANMPFVMFTPYEYKLPEAVISTAKVEKSQKGDIIALYIPPDLTEQFGAKWGHENIINANDLSTSVVSKLTKMASDGTGTLGSSIKAATGYTALPTEMMIFQSPINPKLNLKFDLVPRSASESATIQEIIKRFKNYCLPSIASKEEAAAATSEISKFDTPEPAKTETPAAKTEPAPTAGKNSALDKIKEKISQTFVKFPRIWDIQFENVKGPGIPYGSNTSSYPNMALTNVDVVYAGGSTSMLVYTEDKSSVRFSLSLTFESISYAVSD